MLSKRKNKDELEKFMYLVDYDSLTEIYSKTKFMTCTEEMLAENSDRQFVFIRFDIDRFQLINSFFGMEQGDKILCFVAECLRENSELFEICSYARLESDVFVICGDYNPDALDIFIRNMKNALHNYDICYDIVLSFGLYVVDDMSMSVSGMLDRASLASRECKGKYTKHFSFYDNKMREKLIKEQEIVNDMQKALDKNEFLVYLQPKYDISTNHLSGAEALVRWKHPEKGMIMPNEFIPVFESNGFICKLDFYMWERVCCILSDFIQQGDAVFPISVNVSRGNLYDPKFVEKLCNLVERYQVPPELLNLELTESAYTDNPKVMSETMEKLQERGFEIFMDDFGSGYSSLNVLKDLAVDVLKIDMKFLEKTKIPGRGESIIASVIRMAKWLNIPVVAEGVEESGQAEFLRSIGCEYVQGYYYAKPMPVEDYKILVKESPVKEWNSNSMLDVRLDRIWEANSQLEQLFGEVMQATAIYEYENRKVEILRVNNAFYDLFGKDNLTVKLGRPMEFVEEAYRECVYEAYDKAVETKDVVECEYQRLCHDGKLVWIKLRLKYISMLGDKHILFGTLTDITEQKEIDLQLKKMKRALADIYEHKNKMLVVDDAPMNRAILKRMFNEKFEIDEAENGQEALEKLTANQFDYDIVLLDIMMPIMNGEEFLEIRAKDLNLKNVPVVVITSLESVDQQVRLLELGANDYIVKPFVNSIVKIRVKNVLESSIKYKKLLKDYYLER